MRSVVVVFARVDVRHDADVADLVQVVSTSCATSVPPSSRWLNEAFACDLPAVVSEGLVGLRHLVGVFRRFTAAPRPLDASRISFIKRSVIVFSRRSRGVARQPTQARECWHGEALPPPAPGRWSHQRDGANLEGGTDVVECLLSVDTGILAVFSANAFECTVNDALSEDLFPCNKILLTS